MAHPALVVVEKIIIPIGVAIATKIILKNEQKSTVKKKGKVWESKK